MKHTLNIDIETYSSVDLRTSGVYKYAEAEDFEILLFAYKLDDSPVEIVDLASGETLPREINHALLDPDYLKTAFNAQFERVCISRYFHKLCMPDQWECTMVKAAMVGLPLSLDQVAKVLKLSDQKDSAGKALIRYFSMPCKPTTRNGMRTRNMPFDDFEKWDSFKSYCVQDVNVESAIRDRLEWYQIPQQEQEVWNLDQRINDNGIALEPILIKHAIQMDADYSERLRREAVALTGLENPNSVSQLKAWIGEKESFEVDSLNKDVMAEVKDAAEDPDVQRMLELRTLLAKSSIKKYQAMQNYICGDSRAHGLMQYYGASRTGRWSGRGVQIQNLHRISIKDIEVARDLVYTAQPDMIEMLYDSIPDVLAQLVRTAFRATYGHRLIVADFSAIEARVIAWLAGEKWRLEVFRTHGKIYEASASSMFHVPIEEITKENPLRQKGKIAELACIAEGELVLTDAGLVPIEQVTTRQKVWDGQRFVSHEGVIFKGYKKVINYEGLTATPDHLVWVEGKPEPIQFGIAAARGTHLLQSGNGRNPIRACRDNQSGKEMEIRMAASARINEMHGMWINPMDLFGQSYQGTFQRVPKLLTASANSAMVGSAVNRGKTTMRKPERWKLCQLWRKRDSIQFHVRAGRRTVDSGECGEREKVLRNGPDRHQRKLRKRKYPVHTASAEPGNPANIGNSFLESGGMALLASGSYPEIIGGNDQRSDFGRCEISGHRKEKELAADCGLVRTYDIKNAGPRHRFTVSNVLVHNCGYGGGVGAMINMGAVKMGVPEEELPGIIACWRGANKEICRYWSEVETAALEAVESGPTRLKHGITFEVKKGLLFIGLPSGRKLAYYRPEIRPGKFGNNALVYQGLDQTTKQWKRVDTFGGKLVENIVQAVSRDLLAEAMLRLDKAHYQIVAHVHDEVIIDQRNGSGSLAEAISIMTAVPNWAKGLPVAADGFESEFYKK